MRFVFRPISARDMATSCLVLSDPPPKTSEVLTGSSMQIKIPNGNIWTKNLGKMKYFPKLAIMEELGTKDFHMHEKVGRR